MMHNIACGHASYMVPRLAHLLTTQYDAGLLSSAKALGLMLAQTAPFMPAMLLSSVVDALQELLSSCTPNTVEPALCFSLELLADLLGDKEAAETFLAALDSNSLSQGPPCSLLSWIQDLAACPCHSLACPAIQIITFIVSCSPAGILSQFGDTWFQLATGALAAPKSATRDDSHTLLLLQLLQGLLDSGECKSSLDPSAGSMGLLRSSFSVVLQAMHMSTRLALTMA